MLLINRLDKVTQILRPDFSIFSWIISPIEIKIVKTHQMILFFFSLFFFLGGGVWLWLATQSVCVTCDLLHALILCVDLEREISLEIQTFKFTH